VEYTIVNGTLVDGSGGPRYPGDVLIQGGAIAAVGSSIPRRGEVIDARGMAVCPGFIDMHSHSSIVGLADPKLEAKTRQGVSTEVTGPDGYSPAPIRPRDVRLWRTHLAGLEGDPPIEWSWRSFEEYRRRLRDTSTNWAPLVGHGNLRLAVMGMEDRPATGDELRQMCDLLEVCFHEGAFALSTGLIYTPQAYSNSEELVALGRIVAKHDRFFAFHLRTQGAHILKALDEMLEVGRQSGCSLHISHFQMGSREMWRRVGEAVEMIEAARRSGFHVTADQHPYTAGSTMMAALLPPWAHAGGPARLRELLQSGEERSRLERDTLIGLPPAWESRFQTAGAANIRVSYVKSEANQLLVGGSIAEVAEQWGVSPFQAVVRLLLEEDFAVGMILHQLLESDVEEIMRLPWQMFCSDAVLIGKPHPRTYGTFPRVLGRCVRERGVLTLEDAVRKCSAVPAERLGLENRGRLAPGMAADVVIFDPETVIDTATYEDSQSYPVGIAHLFVNGQPVVSGGEHTGALPGQAL
jgi:N-acyl-D-amino-acid deacylase